MLDEEEYQDDSGDPELAFVRLERKFRQKLKENLAQLEDDSGAYNAFYIEYINHTLAAADALGLDILSEYKVPSYRDKDIWRSYQDFTTAVDHYSVKIKISNAQGRRAYSVVFTNVEKEKLRHYVEQIKGVIDRSTLPQAKKEALYDKINAFLEAVDRDRTGLQAFSEFAVGTAHTVVDVADELEPVWKWVHRIAALFGIKLEQQAGSLPPPRRSRQIDGPRQGRLPPPSSESSLSASKQLGWDDDIPF